MNGISIAPAASRQDIDEALRLAASIFASSSSSMGPAEFKSVLWEADPAFRPGNLMLARGAGGRLAGLIRLVPRKLRRGAQAFSVAGISSVCVAPEFRGQGVSILLMERTIEAARERGFDLSVLIARRAADHFYPRFGFWGVSSYSQVSIATPGATAGAITFAKPREEWIGHYAEAHAESYAGCFGRFERDPAYWRFLLRRLGLVKGLAIHSILDGGAPQGYLVLLNGVIVEFAVTRKSCTPALAAALARLDGVDATSGLRMDIPPQHALCAVLRDADFTVRNRECSYGGHMLRILNPARAAALLAERAAARLSALGSAVFSSSADGIGLNWDGRDCRVTLPDGRATPDFRQTCALLGIQALSAATDALADLLPFNLSYPDQL